MTTKARSGKYVRSNGPNFEHGIVVDAVMEKLKPAFKNVDQKVSQATAAVDGIEGRVVLQVHDMFAKFKDEMLLCVKDLVRSLISERDSGPCETFRNPTVGPTEVPGSATDIAGIAERNENIIKNVLSHLSEYSTPPRSNRMSQVNFFFITRFTIFAFPLLNAITFTANIIIHNRMRIAVSVLPLKQRHVQPLPTARIAHVKMPFSKVW